MDEPSTPTDRAQIPDGWLSVYEVADRLNVHRNTIYRQLGNGTFPFRAERVGRVWRIHAADLEASLELTSS